MKKDNCEEGNNNNFTFEELLLSFYTEEILSGRAIPTNTSEKEDNSDFLVQSKSDFDPLMEFFFKHYSQNSIQSLNLSMSPKENINTLKSEPRSPEPEDVVDFRRHNGTRESTGQKGGGGGMAEGKHTKSREYPTPIDNGDCIITSNTSSGQLHIEEELRDLNMRVSPDVSSEETKSKSKNTNITVKINNKNNSVSKSSSRNTTSSGKNFSDSVNHEASTSGITSINGCKSDFKSPLDVQNNEGSNSNAFKIRSVPSTIEISTSPDIFTTHSSESDSIPSVSPCNGRYPHIPNSQIYNPYMPNNVPYMPYGNDHYMRYGNAAPIFAYDNGQIMPYGNAFHMPNCNLRNGNGFCMSNTNMPFMPNANVPYIPNANGPYMTNINDFYMLGANYSCHPNVNGMPSVNWIGVSDTNGSPILNANKNHRSNANGTCVHSPSANSMPNANRNHVPNANDARASNANDTRASNARATHASTVSGTGVHNASGTHASIANGTGIPNTNNARIPNANGAHVPKTEGIRVQNGNGIHAPNTNITYVPNGNSMISNTCGPCMPLRSKCCCHNCNKLMMNSPYDNNFLQFPALLTSCQQPNLLTTTASNSSIPTRNINSQLPFTPAIQPSHFPYSCNTTLPVSNTPQNNHSGGLCNICNYSHSSSIHTRRNENNPIPGNETFIRPHLASNWNSETFSGRDGPWTRPRERCSSSAPRVASGFHRRLPSLRNLPKSSLNNFRFKGKKVLEKYGRVCGNCEATHSRTWKYDEEGRPYCNTCRYFHVHHRGPPPMTLKNIMQGRNRRGSESEGS